MVTTHIGEKCTDPVRYLAATGSFPEQCDFDKARSNMTGLVQNYGASAAKAVESEDEDEDAT